MATEERLPPACAFALAVLAEYNLDPEAVPEEAVEAAQQHMETCARCSAAQATKTTSSTPRKKKKVRRMVEAPGHDAASVQTASNEAALTMVADISEKQETTASIPPSAATETGRQVATIPQQPEEATALALQEEAPIDCQQCRQLLPEYAEALDGNKNIAYLYPEIQAHLLTCESGCLVLLDFFRQEAKATRKYRRRPVRDPFSAIFWELTGFFRSGRITMAPMALAYGTLILLLLVASLAAYAGFTINDARYHPHSATIPTPDGVGLSDGLKIFDACNMAGFQQKKEASQALQDKNYTRSESLLKMAVSAVQTDTTGCNGAEAAIYRADAQVRQSGRPFAVTIVSFDSGPGNADPTGGTDRHILYAAYTQELIGAFIAQQQYNTTQMQKSGAPLLYLVLANTTGTESGALQVANTVATLSQTKNYQQSGLLIQNAHPLLGVLGLGPSSLVQVVLPVLCRAGVPIIAPTSTGLYIIDLINQTSLYQHCTPGFSFVRFSPDDASQSAQSANYAHNQLQVQNAAIFYDPSNPSSEGSAQGFINTFTSFGGTQIVARETAVASGLLDANGRPQASREDLLAGLNDALKASPRPDAIYAPLLSNDVTILAQAIARLPKAQQPILVIGGEFVQPAAVQSLVQWTRQNQLTLPRIFAGVSAAAHPTSDTNWQKQFYASFCTSFAAPGNYCSGAATLDQGALLFGDGVELLTNGIGTDGKIATGAQLLQNISTEDFTGVSGPISLTQQGSIIISKDTHPAILGVQGDGSIVLLQ